MGRDRRSNVEARALLIGIGLSVVVHGAVAWLLSRYEVALPPPRVVTVLEPTEVIIYEDALPETPPVVRIPAPATPVARPRPPAPDFQPAEEPESLEPPELIPHDVPPRLINGADVMAALEGGYPEDLPEEAGRSRVLLWLFVDQSGAVTRIRLQTSSGFEELDALATSIAPDMAYSPALHRGAPVAVWVAQRIRFRPPDEPLG